MSSLVTLPIAEWRPALAADAQRELARSLEGGTVLVLPKLAFALSERERRFLSPQWSDGRAKNISLEGASIRGARGSAADLSELAAMIATTKNIRAQLSMGCLLVSMSGERRLAARGSYLG